MQPQALLEILYRREAPVLKANDWPALRVSTSQLVQDLSPIPQAEVFAAINMLRQQGKVMLLPDWHRWGLEEDESDGSVADSTSQWEPQGGTEQEALSWRRRRVFLPRDLSGWCLRSRIAETIRLIGSNRERFGLEPATAHVGYELQERQWPSRNLAIQNAIADLTAQARSGAFPRATQPDFLAQAIDIVGTGFGPNEIAGFQHRAWCRILLSFFGGESCPLATMLTAGVSSGKTFGFLLPTVTLLVYRALCGDGGVNRVLIIYPRTSLVEDQYHNLRRMIERVNAEMGRRQLEFRLTPTPALDAGNLLRSSLDLQMKGSLADVLPEVSQLRIEVILTTPESLKNRLLDPRAARTYLSHVEVVVFDEVHLMEGLAGCQQVYLVRRIRELMREMRRNPDFQPAWVGASATVAQPVDHACRVFSIPQQQRARVEHIRPNPDEMERFATFHHAFVHTRVGKPAISAITNGLACLAHVRNDGTAHTHYVDPSVTPLMPRPSEQMPKTIVFVDSLSTIGRLDFTTRDNERCWDADEETPYPYYTWFYRPAARLRATQGEGNQITSLPSIRSWCQKCYDGIPARIEAVALHQLPHFLRTGKTVRSAQKATPPGLAEALVRLSGQIGNLDRCPFHQACVCWWFSQDRGDRHLFGQVPIYIDQNRTIMYTSRSGTATGILSPNVNDYFRRSPTGLQGLWTVRDDQLRSTLPREPEPVSTMLASPRIEVGVDFQNVRDGLTHKALRSAASFQQKVGRVGREDGSDSLIVTFLAHRSTDAHFAHHPTRLIDSQQLDPIPLASENRDVLKTHLFTAILEYIGTRRPGTIPAHGEALNIIGTGSANRVPESWEDKVRACVDYLHANRQIVRDYILRATGQLPGEAQLADQAIDNILAILGLVLTDLLPAFVEGRTAAHWFKQNQQPNEIPSFTQMIEQRKRLLASLGQVSGLPAELSVPTQALLTAVLNGSVTAINAAILPFQGALVQQAAFLPPSTTADLFRALVDAQALAQALTVLPPATNLATICRAWQLVQQFFQLERDQRVQQQYYFHDILTTLLSFRDYYPFGLLRTHFQPIQAREVNIQLPAAQGNSEEDTEALESVLYELLPGAWNYRWGRSFKSPCGRIEQAASGEWFINITRIASKAQFEETGTFFQSGELPADMPVIAGTVVPMLRPVRLTMEKSWNQPLARRDDGLVADNDEAPPPDSGQDFALCPTLPRAFPAIWYRVVIAPGASTVIGQAAPDTAQPVPHTFPALGRVLLDRATFSERVTVDRYAYALDRAYGTEVQSPRIHYRQGGTAQRPVVIGDTLMSTDGLTLHLQEPTVNAVLDLALNNPGAVRGEMTLRAIRAFIASSVGCDPFRSDMLRKIIAAAYLGGGGTLDSLDSSTVQSLIIGITRPRYDTLVRIILDGVFAGDNPVEVRTTRQRQEKWYEEAWEDFVRLQAAARGFDDARVRQTARDILVHSLAVSMLDSASQLVGASDGDLSYFYRADLYEVYIFDSVDAGNGYSETVERFLQIPPLRRVLASREGEPSADLPSVDWFALLDEVLSACPAQTTARLLWEACRQRISSPAQITFPQDLPLRDLEARLRHEFDPITGASAIVNYLILNHTATFRSWQDLLWLQIVPEFFTVWAQQQGVALNLSSFVARTQLCITGCLECVNNGEGSVHGSLLSGEHVSRNLLDLLLRVVRQREPGAFLSIAPAADLGGALQARAGGPVILPNGQPATVSVLEGATTRQVMLTQVLGGIAAAPDDASAPMLASAGGSSWSLQLPLVARYRDERPAPP